MSAPTNAPRRRAFATLFLGAGAAAALVASLPPLPDGARPAAVQQWWSAGAATAPMTVVHLAALGLAVWLAVIAALHLVALVRPGSAVRAVYGAVTTTAVRQALGGTAVVALSLPTPAAALDDPTEPPPPASPPIVLVAADDGAPATTADIVLRDLGPTTETTAPTEPSSTPAHTGGEGGAPAPTTVWHVEPGDHLWHIARETLRDRALPADDADVDRYWRRVIAANTGVVGDDPDLIHPGDTIVLPD